MKNRIIVTKVVKEVKENDEFVQREFLEFHLKNQEGIFRLFTQPSSKGVYKWFKDGRAEGEVLSFAKWKYNKRINDTINRILREIRYVQKYIMEQERAS